MRSRKAPAMATTLMIRLTLSDYRSRSLVHSNVLAGPAIRVEDVLEPVAPTGEGLQGPLDRVDDAGERDLAGEERVDGVLIGGIQHGRTSAAGLGRASGQ